MTGFGGGGKLILPGVAAFESIVGLHSAREASSGFSGTITGMGAYEGNPRRQDIDEAVKLAAWLRRSGTGVIEAMGGKSLKAQLRQANILGAHYTVIIGEREVTTATVILWDMSNSQQTTIPLAQLQQELQQMAA